MSTLEVLLGGILCLIGMTIVIVGVGTGRKQLTKKSDMEPICTECGAVLNGGVRMKWIPVENENDLWPEDMIVRNARDACLYILVDDKGNSVKIDDT